MTNNAPWPDLASELTALLASGLHVNGTAEEADILTAVGNVALEIVIEASDLTGANQRETYDALCNLLAARLDGNADQVFACLIFETEPDPTALASALEGMTRGASNSVFTPVLPLSGSQARALADASMTIDEIIDAATDLISVAADRRPPTVETANTLLAELDELIERRVGS